MLNGTQYNIAVSLIKIFNNQIQPYETPIISWIFIHTYSS